MGTFLYRTENVTITQTLLTFTHGLGVAPANELGEVFIRHRTGTVAATVLTSSSQLVVLIANSGTGVSVDLLVMAFHSIVR